MDDPISETITYDDFAKIDLRVALIKESRSGAGSREAAEVATGHRR